MKNCENCGWSQWRLGLKGGYDGEPHDAEVLTYECPDSGREVSSDGIHDYTACKYWTDKDMTNPANGFEASMAEIYDFYARYPEIPYKGIENRDGMIV